MTAIIMDEHGDRRVDIIELWPSEYVESDPDLDFRPYMHFETKTTKG